MTELGGLEDSNSYLHLRIIAEECKRLGSLYCLRRLLFIAYYKIIFEILLYILKETFL